MYAPKEAHPNLAQIEDISALQSWYSDLKNSPVDWNYFQFTPDADHCQETMISRRPILDFGDQGFLLSDLLSPNECQQLIEYSETLNYERVAHLPDIYRSNKRIICLSDGLSQTLWSRVKPYLKPLCLTGNHMVDHVYGNPGTLPGLWTPTELNPMFRICRYFPGEHFAPHFDGFLNRVGDKGKRGDRSLQTLMLYLNGPIDGGSTNFLDEASQLSGRKTDEEGKIRALESEIRCRVAPEPGLGIVFNHHRLHEGERLKSGVKYILRTDIMFTKRRSLLGFKDNCALM